MNDEDKKPMLPVYLILGASDISRIKTSTPARVGRYEMPVGEKRSGMDHHVTGTKDEPLLLDVSQKLS